MTNEKIIRTSIFIFAAVIHLLVLFFLVFKTNTVVQEVPENARIMKLTDFEEIIPEPEIPQVEAIAEKMIETDVVPEQHVLAAGVFLGENYLSVHQVSEAPKFEVSAVMKDLVYPPIAQRTGIEGRVILELFVDRTGVVQKITILREEPEGRGFGEAAVKAFTGRRGVPAYANGEAVSCRYRYPVTFKLK